MYQQQHRQQQHRQQQHRQQQQHQRQKQQKQQRTWWLWPTPPHRVHLVDGILHASRLCPGWKQLSQRLRVIAFAASSGSTKYLDGVVLMVSIFFFCMFWGGFRSERGRTEGRSTLCTAAWLAQLKSVDQKLKLPAGAAEPCGLDCLSFVEFLVEKAEFVSLFSFRHRLLFTHKPQQNEASRIEAQTRSARGSGSKNNTFHKMLNSTQEVGKESVRLDDKVLPNQERGSNTHEGKRAPHGTCSLYTTKNTHTYRVRLSQPCQQLLVVLPIPVANTTSTNH